MSSRSLALAGGIVSSAIYVGADLLAAYLYPASHSFFSQTISELPAIGAPTRPLVGTLFAIHAMLALTFGLGVVAAAGRHVARRTTGWLVTALGIVDLTAPFFPIHVRGVQATSSDATHVVLTAVTVLLILTAIGASARAFGPAFHVYAVTTLLIVLAFGALGGLYGPRLAANAPTPWLGIIERISIGAYLLWQAVLAWGLLRDAAWTRQAGLGHGAA